MHMVSKAMHTHHNTAQFDKLTNIEHVCYHCILHLNLVCHHGIISITRIRVYISKCMYMLITCTILCLYVDGEVITFMSVCITLYIKHIHCMYPFDLTAFTFDVQIIS